MQSENPAAPARERQRSLFRWPFRILGPRPTPGAVNRIAWAVLAGLFLTRFFIPLWFAVRSGAQTFPILPADFVYFYGIGSIARAQPLSHVYDYDLQLKTFNALCPLHEGAYGPSPYPPWVALSFSLLARIPFRPAFLIWMAASLALYIAGIVLAARAALFRGPPRPYFASLVACASLAFYPFVFGVFTNGQLSALAVFAVGLSIALESHGQPLLSGLALSILAYKPTLLLLLVPMLLLTRRFRALGGFAVGSAFMAAIATAFSGFAVWPAYLDFLRFFGRLSRSDSHWLLHPWEFIDLNSLSYEIPGGRSTIGLAVLAIVTIAVIACLAVLFWRSASCGRPAQLLAWAAALTWTLVLNIYVPIYDSVLLAIAFALTIAAAGALELIDAQGWLILCAALIVAVSWIAQEFVASYKVQPMTPPIVALGLAQLWLLRRALRPAPHLSS